MLFIKAKEIIFIELMSGSKFMIGYRRNRRSTNLLDYSKVSDEPDTEFVMKLAKEYQGRHHSFLCLSARENKDAADSGLFRQNPMNYWRKLLIG